MTDPSRSKRAFTIGLGAILVLALLIRVLAVERYDAIAPATDALDYDRHAVSIADGHGYPRALPLTGGPGPSAFRPPVYPYVLAGVYEISGTADESRRWKYGRVAQALIGGLVVGLIALVALQLWGRREALIAAGIATIYPPLILVGTTLLTEPIFMTFLMGGVAAILHYRRSDDRLRWLVLAGVLAGLATLTRSNGALVIAVLALGAWTLRPRVSWRALTGPALVAVSAATVIAPWTTRNASEFDAFVPVSTQSGFALAGQYNDLAAADRATWVPPFTVPAYRHLFARDEPLGEVELSARLTDLAMDYAGKHPDQVATTAFWGALRFFHLADPVSHEREVARFSGQPQGLAVLSVYSFWLLVPLAGAALFAPATRRIPTFVWIVPPLLLLSVMFFNALLRYRTPADPILILIAASGLSSVWGRLADGSPPVADEHRRRRH